jgi:hypothetical protein
VNVQLPVNPLSIAEVARQLRVSRPSIYNYINVGVRARGGRRVLLPATRVGGRLWIEAASVQQFLSVLNSTHEAASTPAMSMSM